MSQWTCDPDQAGGKNSLITAEAAMPDPFRHPPVNAGVWLSFQALHH
ncbi:hypothetical protein KZX70_06520 [Paenibacillus silvae]|nr:hypothetical protein [Paenibacillus silvae]MCK6266324.1 hypothetical protein [Paenibacillus silvae]